MDEFQLSMILAVLPDECRINSVAQKRRKTDTGKGKETIETGEKEKKNKEYSWWRAPLARAPFWKQEDRSDKSVGANLG